MVCKEAVKLIASQRAQVMVFDGFHLGQAADVAKYALTGAVIAQDRAAIAAALLIHAAVLVWIVMGWRPHNVPEPLPMVATLVRVTPPPPPLPKALPPPPLPPSRSF